MDSVTDTLAGGFPHSEISGSKFARNSPELIAACYVLHRLLAPRHPPNALLRLISTLSVTPSSHLRELTAKYVCNLASLGRTQGRSAFARSAKTPYGSSVLCAEFSNQIRTDVSFMGPCGPHDPETPSYPLHHVKHRGNGPEQSSEPRYLCNPLQAHR